MQLILPEILQCPPKLLPIITDFDRYQYFLIEGGRGGGKSQFIGRLLTYIAEENLVRIVCGREILDTIEESVYTLLADLVRDNDLAFDVKKNYIRHMLTKSEFKFKGFQERGSPNVKGLEAVDILWIDEAQQITKPTLDVLIPTIRKANSKVIFTMNRFMRDDAVPNEFIGRDDCLHIKINYHENPFCPLKLKIEAEIVKNRSEKEYRHIWLGEPLASADDYLFNLDKVYAAQEIVPFGELFVQQRVLAVDFAAQGNDHCVATILDRASSQHWKVTEQITWDEDDTMISVGKIVDMIGRYKPTISIIDIGGMGKPVYDRINEVLSKSGQRIYAFDGGSTKDVPYPYTRRRVWGYYLLREWFDSGFLVIDPRLKQVMKELEKIKMRFTSSGKKELEKKTDMKGWAGFSPDHADSLMMAVFAAVNFIGKDVTGNTSGSPSNTPRRVNKSKRGQRS